VPFEGFHDATRVIQDQGPEAIEKTIGVDATGMRFNSHCTMLVVVNSAGLTNGFNSGPPASFFAISMEAVASSPVSPGKLRQRRGVAASR